MLNGLSIRRQAFASLSLNGGSDFPFREIGRVCAVSFNSQEGIFVDLHFLTILWLITNSFHAVKAVE
jgi:hypothetical protein